MIKVKIKKDSDIVAKIVLIDKENKILFLKRSDFHKKHPGELDLPGGHLKEDESLSKGLAREVKEETGLDIKNPIYFKKVGNKHFYYGKCTSKDIKLSKEHSDHGFYDKSELDPSKKFEKIAIEVMEKIEND